MDHLFAHRVLAHKVWGFSSFILTFLGHFFSHFCDLILRWWICDLDGLLAIIWSFLPGPSVGVFGMTTHHS